MDVETPEANEHILDLRGVWDPGRTNSTIVLLASLLLVAAHRYFGSLEFAALHIAPSSRPGQAAYMFAAAFLLFGVLPLLVVVVWFRQSLRDFGLQLGDWRTGLKATAILFPIIAGALLYPASLTVEMRQYYPVGIGQGDSLGDALGMESARAILFYTSWEFLFRGFMLFGLRKHMGTWQAICVQTIPSCLWHIGLPTAETFFSIPGGILFGILAVKTRSILWPMLLHVLIGACLDFFILIA